MYGNKDGFQGWEDLWWGYLQVIVDSWRLPGQFVAVFFSKVFWKLFALTCSLGLRKND